MKKEKLVAGALIGAAAGIAAVLFFNTTRGKKILGNIRQIASETMEDAIFRLGNVQTKIGEKIFSSESGEGDDL